MDERQEIEELKRLAGEAVRNGHESSEWKADDLSSNEEDEEAIVYVEVSPERVEGIKDAISILFTSDWGTIEQAQYIAYVNPERITRLLSAVDRIATERTRREDVEAAEKQWTGVLHSDYDSGVMAASCAILALSETQQPHTEGTP